MYRLLLLITVFLSAVASAQGHYKIEPARTVAHFKIGYLALMTIDGRIKATGGRMVLDRRHNDSQLTVELDPATIKTGSANRDRKLKNQANLFDVSKYPRMRFQSSDIRFDAQDPSKATAYGQLTMHGVTKPIRLDVNNLHCGQPPGAGGSKVCRMTAKTQINRKRFGMTGLSMVADDTVHIAIAVVAQRDGS